jgi:hypothetical protein
MSSNYRRYEMPCFNGVPVCDLANRQIVPQGARTETGDSQRLKPASRNCRR